VRGGDAWGISGGVDVRARRACNGFVVVRTCIVIKGNEVKVKGLDVDVHGASERRVCAGRAEH